MFARTRLLAILVALFLVGCSSSSSVEKEESTTSDQVEKASTEASEEADETEKASKDAKPKLAACTGGNVPEGATSCLLDLGTGEDTYWSDTDGVDPGTAGCHDEYKSESCEEFKKGRTFGEFCLDEDRLVESNPGSGECHKHGGDMGKPDVVSCSEWCQSESGTSGKCEGEVTAEAEIGTCQSARCVCDSKG